MGLIDELTKTTNPAKAPFHQNVGLKAWVIVGEFAIVVVMLFIATRAESARSQALGGGLALLAIMNFVVFFQADEGESRTSAMRRAITGAVVVSYLVFISLVVVSPNLQEVASGTTDASPSSAPASPAEEEPSDGPLARDLVNRLGVVVSTIVAFYFVTSAAETVADKVVDAKKAEPAKTKEKKK